MKKLIWIWTITLLLGWIFYVGFRVFMSEVNGSSLDLQEIVITGFFYVFIVTLFVSSPPMFTYIPRVKYLESNDCSKPTFKVTSSTAIDMPQGCDFSRLKNEIACEWKLVFFDDVAKVLKFKTKMKFFGRWSVAAWLKYDSDSAKILLECFWMAGMQDNNRAQKLQKKIEEKMKNFTGVQ